RELILTEICAQRLRRALHRSRPDRFMRVLGTLLRPVVDSTLRKVVGTVLAADEIACLLQCALGYARRIGTHVGDQSNGAFIPQFHSLVKLLSELHRPLRSKSQLA